jgi:hypothetical protein
VHGIIPTAGEMKCAKLCLALSRGEPSAACSVIAIVPISISPLLDE